MNRNLRRTLIAALTLTSLLALAQVSSAAPFSQSKIILEINASAGDGGIQIFLDATGWNLLGITDPNGQRVFDVTADASVGVTGVTELFFESAEPSFEDLPLDQLLARFPAGRYEFEGTTVDGKHLSSGVTLEHRIPAGPQILSPAEGSTVSPGLPVVISWNPVTGPYPGTFSPISIGSYQVIVERVKPQPLLVFSVHLPATVNQVTVPAEFIQANADYKLEVLAIEESQNQTITEGSFKTSR